MLRNSRNGWGLVTIFFHWLSALTIIGLFALGWWMTGLGYYDPWYNQAPWIHRSIGLLLLFATFARLIWRIAQPSPNVEGTRLERMGAHLGHIALYVLVLVVMVSGYLISTANGRGISVFGWFEVPALVHGLPNQASLAGDIHWYTALALMILAAGHALAALKHHWFNRDKTLVRMLNPAYSNVKDSDNTAP
ncbi:MAG: cytochrome b [Halomonas sp.]|nr:cytochrome b [Halomonas sp.]TVP46809.1 MAG: cytochrome b [Halomonas sp.]